ncbi:MAG: hypothetical protein IIB56_10540 [Planctomycetes bacterium]|nr:hypothetical protein [Planctomycetota bacterium]MCH8121144.1 hypothetical protein [Planctomycetota bacterium]
MSKDDISTTTTISKEFSQGLSLITLKRPSVTEYFITVVPTPGRHETAMFAEVADILRRNDAQIISQDIFTSLDGDRSTMQTIRDTIGPLQWPITCIDSASASSFAGTQIWAVSGIDVQRLMLYGTVVGSLWEDNYAKYCRLGGLSSRDTSSSREAQAHEIFDQMETALASGGMELSNILRTWFYLDDILAWYGDFNKVRDGFYSDKGIFNGLVPASTGIGGSNITGSAVMGGLVAVEPKNSNIQTKAVASPLQCPALDYGSSFSRAVELTSPCHRRLFVSGTASIAPEGHTVHLDDVDAQVAKTMEVVYAILKSRGMDWSDVVKATAYVKEADDIPAYHKYCTVNKLPPMPIVVANSTVCREDLLFEVEVDAIKKGRRASPDHCVCESSLLRNKKGQKSKDIVAVRELPQHKTKGREQVKPGKT